MNDEVKPRVWVGRDQDAKMWWYQGRHWSRMPTLDYGDIFVPGNFPEPTIDPSKMKTIATCSKVDW